MTYQKEHAQDFVGKELLTSGQHVLQLHGISVAYHDIFVIVDGAINESATFANVRAIVSRIHQDPTINKPRLLGELFAAVLRHQAAFCQLLQSGTDDYLSELLDVVDVIESGMHTDWITENDPSGVRGWIATFTNLVTSTLVPSLLEFKGAATVAVCPDCRR